MMAGEHERARKLIALSGAEELPREQQRWLRGHQQQCAACRDYEAAAGQALRALRAQPLAANAALVAATQMRVRLRALELRRQVERRWVIGVCCVAVTLSTALTTAAQWGGLAWVGQNTRLAGAVWALAVLGWVPAMAVAILLLARGTFLGDHSGMRN